MKRTSHSKVHRIEFLQDLPDKGLSNTVSPDSPNLVGLLRADDLGGLNLVELSEKLNHAADSADALLLDGETLRKRLFYCSLNAMNQYVNAGLLLCQIKDHPDMKHGQFKAWIKEHFARGYVTASYYMKLHHHRRLVSEMTAQSWHKLEPVTLNAVLAAITAVERATKLDGPRYKPWAKTQKLLKSKSVIRFDYSRSAVLRNIGYLNHCLLDPSKFDAVVIKEMQELASTIRRKLKPVDQMIETTGKVIPLRSERDK
jgi:hypothetical protein